MGKTIVSDFDTYAQASEVVRDLELEGITGTEVEVVSDADHDIRGVANAKYSARYGAGRRIVNGMSHFLHSLGANEVQKGRAMVIVRASDRNAERVSELLLERGGEIRQSQN